MDWEEFVRRLIQVGTVTALDANKNTARVKFQDTGITSDWLHVLQHPAMGVAVAKGSPHTHTISDTYSGGGSASQESTHTHPGTVTTSWMPKVNDTVLVFYLPVFNSDGFIIGKI